MMEDLGETSIMLNIKTDGERKVKKVAEKKRRIKTPSLHVNSGIIKEKRINSTSLRRPEGPREIVKNETNIDDRKERREKLFEKGKFGKRKKPDKDFVPSLFSHNPDIPDVHLQQVKQVKESLFSNNKFAELTDLHPHLLACLRDRLKVDMMTKIQQLTIPLLMANHDCLIKSATGSGKTLAYLIPIIQKLQAIRPEITRKDGIHCLLIVPTRELVAQCFTVVSTLCQPFTRLVSGCLMGGEKKKSEKNRIRKGINILIATPGRLLDHISSTANLKFDKIRFFVIDEADRLKEQGFEEAIRKIIDNLSENCKTKPQSMLLSATLTKNVQDLAGITLQSPKIVDLSEGNSNEEAEDIFALPPQLKLHYLIVPAKLRLIALCSFIINQCSKRNLKALIFMSTQDSVDFYEAIFSKIFNPLIEESNLSKVKFFKLHGNMDQSDRMSVFNEFQSINVGVLLCTDVAARGLDLPLVDWIVQFSCPARVEDFVHRVGRTARIGAKGDALIFILPSESGFLQALQNGLNVNINPCDLDAIIKSLLLIKLKGKYLTSGNPREYASKLQQDFEKYIYDDECILNLAKKAYIAYVRAYASYPKDIRHVLPFKDLHLGHVATSFCLHDSPKELGAGAYLLRQSQRFGRKSNYGKSNYNDNSFGKLRHKRSMPSEIRSSEFDNGLLNMKRDKKL